MRVKLFFLEPLINIFCGKPFFVLEVQSTTLTTWYPPKRVIYYLQDYLIYAKDRKCRFIISGFIFSK
ncbi:MAG: hypothetical protein D8M57_14755 [Candidatus Scalindua sp. AMX11]|nr:MAG: hypothetical protein DWQ00_02715 [Candidatus Scalindua sp.]TDE64167.1 MAG: hypothetical protein D8M57_14755 [Candidatus Scalindua sp. AMX11]